MPSKLEASTLLHWLLLDTDEKREELKLVDVEIEAFGSDIRKLSIQAISRRTKGDLYAGSVKYISALVVADDIKAEVKIRWRQERHPLYSPAVKADCGDTIADTVKG